MKKLLLLATLLLCVASFSQENSNQVKTLRVLMIGNSFSQSVLPFLPPIAEADPSVKLILRKPNFLILDEPTNHLDVSSREILEEALASFEGTILCVSHDRYFVNRLATRVLSFRGDGVTQIEGNYDAYVSLLQADAAEKPAAAVKKPNAYLQRKEAERAERLKASRVKKIEARLAAIEQEKEELETALALPETAADYEKVLFLTGQLTALGDERDALEEEWLTLSE